tara:strand:+ start:3024 stop:4136 length:1113 start_codon:yes stop_codon:yes gene_type:complete
MIDNRSLSRKMPDKGIAPFASIYADVNSKKPENYWNYNEFRPSFGKIDKYEVTKKIGRGRYSEVFNGNIIGNTNISTSKNKCVIKMLKPIRNQQKKLRREILILQNLSKQKNIIKLLDIVRDEDSSITCLVFEHINNTNCKELYPTLSESDIRYYVDQIFVGLESCHSCGIMHRDLKPDNIVIDHQKKELRIIDWGLGEFYHPGQEYSCRVATRYYKSPEIMIDMDNTRHYDYALDIWSAGCIAAQMMYRINPFFDGADNHEQLVEITKVLGTDELLEWIDESNFKLDEYYKPRVIEKHRPRKDLKEFINENNSHLVSKDGINFLEKIFVFNPQKRMTAREAMCHKWLNPLPNKDLKKRGIDPENPNTPI